MKIFSHAGATKKAKRAEGFEIWHFIAGRLQVTSMAVKGLKKKKEEEEEEEEEKESECGLASLSGD